jgi:DMSO/TMAO reductase YedYZ molybdopterin-dependent catalytic subunit
MAVMSEHTNPFHDTSPRPHQDERFLRHEIQLVNRNSGIALEALVHDLTPVGLHYLLTHFDIPNLDRETMRLAVSGRVKTPLELSVADLEGMGVETRTVTLECAGNGRNLLAPRYPSNPWGCEAVGTAEWTGVPLNRVLEQVELLDDAVEVAFIGADRGFDRGIEHDYGRSLSVDHAMRDEVMLVTGMNGMPLLPQHGAPLRLVVPGWYGMASVKWLTRIEVLDKPYDGYQQAVGYHYRQSREDRGVPVREIRVKSLMVPPGIPDWFTRERMVDAGTVRLMGRAWSGNGVEIDRVEVGVDGVWHAADLGTRADTYAWTPWQCNWQAVPGEHELCCRATDANGDEQPLEARWDHTGLGNNCVQRVRVTVR